MFPFMTSRCQICGQRTFSGEFHHDVHMVCGVKTIQKFDDARMFQILQQINFMLNLFEPPWLRCTVHFYFFDAADRTIFIGTLESRTKAMEKTEKKKKKKTMQIENSRKSCEKNCDWAMNKIHPQSAFTRTILSPACLE